MFSSSGTSISWVVVAVALNLLLLHCQLQTVAAQHQGTSNLTSDAQCPVVLRLNGTDDILITSSKKMGSDNAAQIKVSLSLDFNTSLTLPVKGLLLFHRESCLSCWYVANYELETLQFTSTQKIDWKTDSQVSVNNSCNEGPRPPSDKERLQNKGVMVLLATCLVVTVILGVLSCLLLKKATRLQHELDNARNGIRGCQCDAGSSPSDASTTPQNTTSGTLGKQPPLYLELEPQERIYPPIVLKKPPIYSTLRPDEDLYLTSEPQNFKKKVLKPSPAFTCAVTKSQ